MHYTSVNFEAFQIKGVVCIMTSMRQLCDFFSDESRILSAAIYQHQHKREQQQHTKA